MSRVRVSGTWRDLTSPHVKIGGNWKIAKSAWAKVDDKWKSWFLQGGVLDAPMGEDDNPSFQNFNTNLGVGTTAIVYAIAIQSDGKIIIGGSFASFNNITQSRLLRLNSDGTLDTAFTANIDRGSTTSFVETISIQSDGKIIVGGGFTIWNLVTVNRIVRLNSDGTGDTTFTTNTGTAANGAVTSTAIQSDGKIIVVGSFATWNGVTVNRIVRLNSDGTRDTTFTTNVGTGANLPVNSIAIQPNGQILIGGNFATWNGVTVNSIVRLNSDGTREVAFNTNTGTGSNASVLSIAVQSDGKIILAGSFTTWNGVTVNRIVRLNSDGTREVAFNTNTGTGFSSSVNSVAIQSDGKIVVGGGFTAFNGVAIGYILRLNSDGTRDVGFTNNGATGASAAVRNLKILSSGNILLGGDFAEYNESWAKSFVQISSNGAPLPIASANSSVFDIVIQPDGKILIGGAFTKFNDTSANCIIRLNQDGSVDTAFMANVGTGVTSDSEDAVFKIALQPDGKIVIGSSTGVDMRFNGVSVRPLFRLNSDGTLDTAFTTNMGSGPNSSVNAIAIQSNGQILIGGNFTQYNLVTGVTRIARINSDGTRDTTFTTNVGTTANAAVHDIAIQADGKSVIVGSFTTFGGTAITGITRLNTDGTRDATFPTGTNFNINAGFGPIAVKIQSDQKIVVGGIFTSYRAVTRNRIARLNTDGTLDTSFVPDLNALIQRGVNQLAIQPDGKIVILGAFTVASGVTVNGIARLNTNGTLDTSFSSNTGTGTNNDMTAMRRYGVAIQSDSKVLLGGEFTSFNGKNRSMIARIGGDIAG